MTEHELIPTEFRTGNTQSSPVDDRLGREPLARQLAWTLGHQKAESNSVVAVCGHWGSGKSWVISRAKQILEDCGKDASVRTPEDSWRPPVCMEFNPWQWSGNETQTAEFFDQLKLVIKQIEQESKPHSKLDSVKRLWPFRMRHSATQKQLTAYAARLSTHTVLIEGLNKGVLGLVSFLALLASARLFKTSDWWTDLFAALGMSLVTVAVVAKLSSIFMESWADAKKEQAEAGEKSFAEQKQELKDTLATLPRPVLVIIDDLDRLSASEVAGVFQLVKAQADFPNVHYMLAFDRSLVAHALEQVAPGVPGNGLPKNAGHEYLEKIVPVIFDLPEVDPSCYQSLLQSDLERIGRQPLNGHPRWDVLWKHGLCHFFHSTRDIDRFANCFEFNAQLLGGADLNVDALDFAIVETLRLFEPNVYQCLSENVEFVTKSRTFAKTFAHTQGGEGAVQEWSQKTRAEIEERLLTKANNRLGVRLLLRHLFEGIDELLQNTDEPRSFVRTACPGWSARIFQSVFFPRYFRYALNEGEWSQAEVKHLVELANDPDEFNKAIEQVSQEIIDFREGRGSEENAKANWLKVNALCQLVAGRMMASALARTNDECERNRVWALSLLRAGTLTSPTRTDQNLKITMAQYAHTIFQQIESVPSRNEIAYQTFQETGFEMSSLLVHFEWQNRQSAEVNPWFSSLRILDDKQFERAKFGVIEQIVESIDRGRLWHYPSARQYLELGKLWDRSRFVSKCIARCSSYLDDAEFCFGFLSAFLAQSEVHPAGAIHIRDQWYLLVDPVGDRAGLSEFASLDRIEAMLPALRRELIQDRMQRKLFGSLRRYSRHASFGWYGMSRYFATRGNPSANYPTYDEKKQSLREDVMRLSRAEARMPLHESP